MRTGSGYPKPTLPGDAAGQKRRTMMTNLNLTDWAWTTTAERCRITRQWVATARLGRESVCAGGKTRAAAEAALRKRLLDGGYAH